MMQSRIETTRRGWFGLAAGVLAAGPVYAAAGPSTEPSLAGQQIPLKIGIRAATLKMPGNLDAVRAAASLPGIRGVELQVTSGSPNLRDWDMVRRYKAEAHRWGISIPSLAGLWDKGVKIHTPGAADNLRASIRAAELLGASVILAAFFRGDAPDMAREDSYGPIVEMLGSVAGTAADAGVVIGLENSLSPADNKKLIDLVDHPAVRVYYDLHNMESYGHTGQSVPGVALLGKERIAMVHVKQSDKLLEEPGLVDWAAAFAALNAIGYEGWFVYESAHDGLDDCRADTERNNAFMARHVRMPQVG